MTTTVSIYDAKAHLSRLVSEVEKTGIHVLICRHKVPVAEIVPIRMPQSDPLATNPDLTGA